jgi:diguanylate cyclase (GGDEF)-like protein
MQNSASRIIRMAVAWAATLGVTAYVLVIATRGPLPADRMQILLALLLSASLAAYLAARRRPRGTPRLALTFVLSGLALLPSPGALIVALGAMAAARGGGVAGPRSSSIAGGAGVAIAVLLARFISDLGPEVTIGTTVHLAWLLFLFLWIQAVAFAVTTPLLGHAAAEALGPGDAPGAARLLALEAACVPLAWLLVSMVERGAWLQATLLTLLVLAAQGFLFQLSRTAGELRRSRRALASRITELDTLHAIGREILASVRPSHVCAVIDRECRKIFDVDFCLVALADAGDGKLTVRHRRWRGAEPETRAVPLDAALVRWVLEHKRGLRIDDFTAPHGEPQIAPPEPDMRSAMVAPLIVEDRVLGLVAIHSGRPSAYDDHQLSVLTTVAHQAAVAIESARHYRQATVDSLTACFLRDFFFERLDEEFERSTRYGGSFSLLMLDLDGFKAINDEHGHLAGDQYLRAVSATIRAQLRAADIACRYGGDEFCLLLPETGLSGARVIAERIRVAVADTVVAEDGFTLRTTASIGLAVHPRDGSRDVNDLLRNADEALYRAKRAGRDCVVPFAA